MKKFLITVLAFVMALGCLAGCSGNEEVKCSVHDYGENHLCVDNTCSVCGNVKKASTSHNYGTWTVVKDAKCNATGLKSHTCKDCGHYETLIIPKLANHSYVSGICEICGATEGSSDGENLVLFDMENEKFAIDGGSYEIKDNAGYTATLDAVEVVASDDLLTVWYFSDEYDKVPVGTLMGLNCRMKILTDAAVNYNDQTGYSQTVKLVNTQSIVVDYAYKLNFWNKVTVDAEIVEVNGKKGACFYINGAQNQTFLFSDFTADDNVMVLENLFGGVKVVQWQYAGALMECYVITSPDGTVMLIDGGADGSDAQINEARESLYQYLVDNELTEIDHWFITHFHNDHVDSLYNILADDTKDIKIENLYYDFPTKELCERYGESSAATIRIVTGMAEVAAKTNSDGSKKVENIVTPKKAQEFVLDDYMTVRILNDAYFHSANNMGNDSSIVYKLVTPGASIAFLGDMGPSYGNVLIEDQYFNDEISTCEVVQMGHHGQNGCTEYFYKQCTAMKICLYSGPNWVYDAGDYRGYGSLYGSGIHTMLTRAWAREIGVKYSYGGDMTLTIGK